MTAASSYIREAERLLEASGNTEATLEEKTFLVLKAQVYATLAAAKTGR